MASSLIFHFAWVTQTDNVWSSAYARNDENPFNIELACEEGQIPKLTIEVINPRIGPLAPGRLHWAWLSMSSGGGAAQPLFFGRLVGIPQTILYNTVKFEFIARAPDYIRQKQLVAEGLKTLPQYDPIFFDIQKRDDPDAILEGYSMLYAVDRVTGAVSVSDILVGEDGTLTVDPSDTYYDSVQMKLQQSPLVAVNVKADVTWDQQYSGYFDVGQWSYPTLGNEPFVNDWPKSGVSFGGGYSGANSFAGIRDPFIQIQTSSNINYSYQWHNTQRHHEEGDTMSITASSSLPTMPMTLYITEQFDQIGIIAPDTTDAGGNPDPTNIPAITRWSAVGVRTFDVGYKGLQAVAALGLRYDANRKRTEQLEVTVQADVQPILIDPLVTEDTETVTLKSGDLSIPTITYLNWSSVSGQPVALGEFIFPDNPLVAGQTSSQICVVAGTAGTVEPTFSNIAGATTTDGTVVWSSLGSTPPTEMAQDWVQTCRISLGTLLLPRPVHAPEIGAYTAAGMMSPFPQGVPTAKYAYLAEGQGNPGDTILQVTGAGIVGGATAAQATFGSFINPSGQDLYICVQPGVTSDFHPTFVETVGAQTSDGSVVWQNIGKVSLAVGGWPGMTPAASYFPTDRGQQSLQHMICRARAKLRRRARAVQVTFQCRFEAVAATISCRKNAAISDPRLPGGTAAGKIVSYKLTRDGDSGSTVAEVTIGCSIGNANVITTTVGGVATYVDGVFNQGEVQVWAGSTISISPTGGDIGYTPPVETVVDDGVSFPVHGYGDVILNSVWHGAATEFEQATQNYNAQVSAAISTAIASSKSVTTGGLTISGGISNAADLQAAMVQQINQSVYQGTYLWYELSLKNLLGGPYGAAYVINTTLLALPKTLDLSAPSS